MMFPAQEDGTVLQDTTPSSRVLETLTLTESGVRCTVQGGDGTYSIDVHIEEQTTTGVGIFQLDNLSVQGGFGNDARLYWLYKGFDYEATNCAVDVDMRIPTEDNPDPLFIEPGMAKVSFTCDPFDNYEGAACSASGTVFVKNCKK
jgi:hypothetical protein